MRWNNRALAVAAALCASAGATAQDGPPPSDGPSATSDRSPDRYDEVGYATWYGPEYAGSRTASGAPFDPKAFTAAHRSLPMGSYVEVTALDTGRTVLVQITDRGPFTPGLLIDLSQAAAQAIGVKSRAAVRVRRVVPDPADRNALKNGQPASPRLDTPPALLAGLRAKLNGEPTLVVTPVDTTTVPSVVLRPPRSAPRAPVVPEATPVVPAKGSYYVQVATLSSRDRAAALAKALGGSAGPFKSLWRVRTGPFADAKSAAQARDAAAARGYGDARVVRED
ncbi:septal ring lytic transglycosylase RlpA family protein [Sphingomonas sp.]|uniref:septal ring lytic transglycosylase RlpA family protein n=1 Tax=Sphingomonas sp. TaxID=28214 RepID=UPI0025ECBF1A|nr:septal ring lytic transglycosylase RlpA family protein [Sphingomonas sp.]